jgi:hypothetical protein
MRTPITKVLAARSSAALAAAVWSLSIGLLSAAPASSSAAGHRAAHTVSAHVSAHRAHASCREGFVRLVRRHRRAHGKLVRVVRCVSAPATRVSSPKQGAKREPRKAPAPAPGPAPSEEPTPAPTPAPGPTPPPAPEPTSGTGAGWNGFGGGSLPGANWRPYGASSPFNQTTEGAAVHPNSAGLVEKALSWGLPGNLVAGNSGTASDWSHPAYYAQPTDPVYTLHATEPWGRNSLEGMSIPIPAGAQPAAGDDGHMTVVTPDGWEYDFWRAQTPPAGGGTLTFAWGGRTRIDGDGLASGATASNFGNLAGMIREPELAAGHIDHALFIVIKCAAKGTGFGYGATTTSYGSSYVYPASHGGSTCAGDDPNLPPLGTRFALAMSDAQIQALAVPSWKKTILTALAHYGGYVGDTGGPGFAFMFESSSSYTSFGLPDPLATFAALQGVPKWNGDYVFNMASGVDWAKYLRALAPPAH